MTENKGTEQAQEPEQVCESEKQLANKEKVVSDGPLTKNYRCFFCGRCFRSLDALMIHMRREHSSSN